MGTVVGIATFVAVVGLFILFGSPNGFTFGAILWFATVSALITSVGVVQKRVAVTRPRFASIGSLVAVVLLLVPLWVPVLNSVGAQSGPTYSGTVASDELSGFALQDQPGVMSHNLALEEGEHVKIVIDGRASWEIQPPDGGTISGMANGVYPEAVTVSDGDIYYTANQTGAHRISIFAEPYNKASYRVTIEDAAG